MNTASNPNPNPNPIPTFLLVGNYGVGNAGDEILRAYFLERFPEVQWQVVSARPSQGELPRFPAGLRSFLSFRWLRTCIALVQSHGLVFGGGSLWTDMESLSACFIWSVHAWFAWFLRKPYFLAFQGIGPFRTKTGERLAQWVVRHAAFISVRDQASFERLSGACPAPSFSPVHGLHQNRIFAPATRERAGWKKHTKVIQSFDPSIVLLEAKNTESRIKNLLVFIPKFCTPRLALRSAQGSLGASTSMSISTNAANILSTLKHWKETQGPVRILSLHAESEGEQELCRHYGGVLKVPVGSLHSLTEAWRFLADASLVLTERYHGALAALACGTPFIALRQETGDKLDALAKLCGCPSEISTSLSLKVLTETDWGRKAEKLMPVRERCLEDARRGEEALREALRRGL